MVYCEELHKNPTTSKPPTFGTHISHNHRPTPQTNRQTMQSEITSSPPSNHHQHYDKT